MVVVKLFAQVRELAGAAEIDLDLAPGARASDVVSALTARLPGLASVLAASRVAVNRAFCPPDTPVGPGDEVAVIPPVSGG